MHRNKYAYIHPKIKLLSENREREREEEIFQWIYTYRNGFAASSLRRGRVEAMPSSQEIFDVGPCRVHDAKSGDVDGPILDHLALPSIVHYLIARKQADCNDCKSSRCRAPHFRLDVHWKRKVHRYGQFDKSNGLSDSEIALVPSSRYVIRRVIFMIRWNFHSIGISVLKMVLRENFNANFNNGRRILATSSGIGIELLPIRLISSGTSFFQARRPSRGLPRYLLPCPWGSRARRICYSICKGLNI